MIFLLSFKLGKLLTSAQNLRKSANLDLSLSAACTLFVCNKWDLVENNEREEVKRDTVGKLTRILGNLDPKSQIVYLSCKSAQLAQTYGVVTEDFSNLITGITGRWTSNNSKIISYRLVGSVFIVNFETLKPFFFSHLSTLLCLQRCIH